LLWLKAAKTYSPVVHITEIFMRQSETVPSSIGFISTYPPTACGLATFTAALRRAMAEGRGSEEGLEVVSLVESRLEEPRSEVVLQHVNGDRSSLQQAVKELNELDVAIFQHEYGIYGGPDGAEILDLIAEVEVPTIVTLHTVLGKPTLRQKRILERIVDLAGQTVVMSNTALHRLRENYDVDPDKVTMVPHGAMAGVATPTDTTGRRPIILTWGLIGPGKGLEIAIEAVGSLKDLRPLPRYVILGKTHPKVQAAQGNAYLDGLKAKSHALGLEDVVEFDSRYLDTGSLVSEIRQADIALLPYESTEQVTSGVLVEALANGKPVVATAFPHAIEMLGGGAGALVAHSDPDGMAAALRSLLSEPDMAARMATMATSIGSTLQWPVVADQYLSIVSTLVERDPVAAAFTSGRRAVGLAKVG
jgi:glycosyltransferase involved in cell wall biosynthesis